MTIRAHLLKNIMRHAEVLNRLSNVAQLLPDVEGPAPTHLLHFGKGEIHYAATQAPAIRYAYGADGWATRDSEFTRGWLDYVKTLPTGVLVVIENAQESPRHDTEVLWAEDVHLNN